jgi:hypothetical protein
MMQRFKIMTEIIKSNLVFMHYVLESFWDVRVYFLLCLKYQLNRSDRNHAVPFYPSANHSTGWTVMTCKR